MLEDIPTNPDLPPPPPPDMPPPPPASDNKRRNMIIAAVVLLFVCCCCAIIVGLGLKWLWDNGDSFVGQSGWAVPYLRGLL